MTNQIAERSPETGLPILSVMPRQDRFLVMIDDRLPRDDTVLMQLAVPREIHQRLKRESLGSLNSVATALIRYAIEKLDESQQTLNVERI